MTLENQPVASPVPFVVVRTAEGAAAPRLHALPSRQRDLLAALAVPHSMQDLRTVWMRLFDTGFQSDQGRSDQGRAGQDGLDASQSPAAVPDDAGFTDTLSLFQRNGWVIVRAMSLPRPAAPDATPGSRQDSSTPAPLAELLSRHVDNVAAEMAPLLDSGHDTQASLALQALETARQEPGSQEEPAPEPQFDESEISLPEEGRSALLDALLGPPPPPVDQQPTPESPADLEGGLSALLQALQIPEGAEELLLAQAPVTDGADVDADNWLPPGMLLEPALPDVDADGQPVGDQPALGVEENQQPSAVEAAPSPDPVKPDHPVAPPAGQPLSPRDLNRSLLRQQTERLRAQQRDRAATKEQHQKFRHEEDARKQAREQELRARAEYDKSRQPPGFQGIVRSRPGHRSNSTE